MLKDRAFLYGSLAARIVSGAVSLLLLAWYLPTRDYGLLVTALTYGQMMGTLSNYGFQTQLLRDVAADPANAGQLITLSMRLKNYLTLALTVPLAAAYLVTNHDGMETVLIVAASYVSGMTYSYCDLLSQSLRSLGRYGRDFRVTLFGYLGYLLAIGVSYVVMPDLFFTVMAILAFRLLHVLVSFRSIGGLAGLGNLWWGDWAQVRRHLRESTSLGIDSTLTSLTAQIDIPLVSWAAGLHAVAGYQVISRIAGYTLMPASILLGLYLPRISAGAGTARQPILKRMRVELLACGFLSAAAIMAASLVYPWFVKADLTYGRAMWAGFAVFTLLKYASSVIGTVLIVTRQVRTRIVAQVVNAVTIVVAMPLVVQRFGVESAPWVLVGAAALTFAVYRTQAAETRREWQEGQRSC